jgi:hypothetical protein
MKKILATTALAAAAVVAPLAVSGPAAATTCSVTWGSLAKSSSSTAHSTLTALRTGRHDCYDRLVVDLTSSAIGYRVRYVSAVRDQGQGAVVPLRGGAFLQIDLTAAATRRPAMPNVAGYTTFRQVGWGGSFEGYSTVGLGVRARLPFRVFRNGTDLVVDVAHHW